MLRVPTTLPVETEDLIHRVIGCGIEVHKALGSGYPKKAYTRAMMIELERQGISYEHEKLIRVSYRDQLVCRFKIDLLVGGALVAEIKCVESLLSVHQSQVLGYLRAAELRAGLSMNFKVGVMVMASNASCYRHETMKKT